MSERVHPTIQPDTLQSVIVEHSKSSMIGLPRRRMVAIGLDDSVPPVEYVHLGSLEQLSHYLQVERFIDKSIKREGKPTMRDVFRLQPHFPATSLIKGVEKTLDSHVIGARIGDGGQMIEGSAVIPSAPGEKPIILEDTTGMWGPTELVLGEWRKIETPQVGQTNTEQETAPQERQVGFGLPFQGDLFIEDRD